MELIDIIAKLKHLDYSQKKYHVDRHGEYAQLVFRNDQTKKWLDSVGEVLGPPVKTKDEPVSEKIITLTEDFGEIFDHQTLFYAETSSQRIIAMLWPWQNNELTTLKIMVVKRA
jgi:hypothetical protein